jgi:hypothetical protein
MQAGGYVTPFFVVGGVCMIVVIPLFLLTSKVPCEYDMILSTTSIITAAILILNVAASFKLKSAKFSGICHGINCVYLFL